MTILNKRPSRQKFPQTSCICKNCVKNCYARPGWMIPNDVKRIARYFAISEEELFQEYLVIDKWDSKTGYAPVINGYTSDIYVLMPGTFNNKTGCEITSFFGKCIFLYNNRCSVYRVRPWECAVAGHDHVKVGEVSPRHLECAKWWIDAQDYLLTLCGKYIK